MPATRRTLCLGAALALLAGHAALAAPIATNTALPIGAGSAVVREQLVFARASAPAGTIETVALRSTLGYGLTPRLAVFGSIPLIERRPAGGATVSGAGDASVFTRYELFARNGVGQTLRVAPFAGVRLPTGREGETGDGSTDLFGGIVVTLATTRWGLDSQLRYDLNRENDGRQAGNVLRAESSFQYRLAPVTTSSQGENFLFGVIELSASRAERTTVGGNTIDDSGGTQFSVTPGLQWARSRLMFDLGFTFPAGGNLNGAQPEPDLTVLASVRINF